MAGFERCALKKRKWEGELERKEKGRGGKMGIKIVLRKFSYAHWSFFGSIKKPVSRVSILFPLRSKV